MRRIFLLFTALAAPVFAQESPHSTEWQGPLPAENGRQLQSVFGHFRAEKPETLAAGRQKWSAQLDVHNNLLIPDPENAPVEEDYETQTLRVGWNRGLQNGWEIGVEGQIVARNGGFLDNPIQLYHDLFGFTGDDIDNPQGRTSRARQRTVFRFTNPDGEGINAGRALGIGDTTFTLKKQLSGGKLATSARLALKIPTGSDAKILGSGGTDVGAVFDARYPLSRKMALSGYFGAWKWGDSAIPGAKSGGVQGGLGLEWAKSRTESYIAQFDGASRSVTTGNAFADRAPFVVSVGWKRQINPNRQFWVFFSENGDYQNYSTPILGSVGPDFSLSLGYSWLK